MHLDTLVLQLKDAWPTATDRSSASCKFHARLQAALFRVSHLAADVGEVEADNSGAEPSPDTDSSAAMPEDGLKGADTYFIVLQ